MRRLTPVILGASVFVFAAGVLLLSLTLTASQTSAQPIFVTNTPPPKDLFNNNPEVVIDRYALRLWDEVALVEVLMSQLGRLARGQTEQERAIRLTQVELETRFPGGPHDLALRDQLLAAMQGAPRGTVDMRSVARPYIVDRMNAAGVHSGVAVVENFRVELTRANFNGDTITDALAHVVYPADATDTVDILYEDFIALAGNEDGAFDLIAPGDDLPVAPATDVATITLVRSGDLNHDGLDEFALAIDDGELNKRLGVYGWRNGELIELTAPGEIIRYGEIISWPPEDTTINVANYQLESLRWNCVTQITVSWEYTNNRYRPSTALNARYTPRDTVGCALLAAEPLYAQPAADAIQTVETILNEGPLNQQGADRGGMALAMLYLLDGQDTRAEEQAAALLTQAESGTWLASQLDAFAFAASDATNDPVQVCAELQREALLTFDDAGAAVCDVDQVLAQLFDAQPVARAGDLVETLNARGLPVLETVTVSQVGFADRQVVNFELPGASWWSFAPTDPDYYVPSPVEAPVAFEAAAAPAGPVEPPPAAYDAFFERRDVTAAITAIENVALQNPDRPLSAEARYMQALGYDLTGDRQRARRAYFAIWSDFNNTAWGQLAGIHLEKR